jgi:trehalose 6-phosphate synthase
MFLHVPFPSRDLVETIPWRHELLDAMLDFDLVGFHTERWLRNFLDASRGDPELAVDGASISDGRRTTAVGCFPIPIDSGAFSVWTEEAADVAGLRAALGQRRLLLGVDRLDYAKGIPERLIAFERLLDRVPGWRGQISFVQISVPSRAEIPDYAELKQRVENLVGRINGKYGEADWVPVRYLYRSYDHLTLAQLYRLADVALVTPLRDGMNLVAKEFVAAQDDAAPGVLVLSRFAGAAEELADAVLTNPFHPDGLADDIDRALRMPREERITRQLRLRDALERGGTPHAWASAFLGQLAARTVHDVDDRPATSDLVRRI